MVTSWKERKREREKERQGSRDSVGVRAVGFAPQSG